MGGERQLEGRLALVTGAAQGIGRAIARRLANDGARVAVNDRVEQPALTELVGEIAGVAAPADVSDRGQVREMVATIEQSHGAIDALVCNAAYMTMSPVLDHSESDWWKVIDTNLTGVFHLVQAVLPGMRRRGSGKIVIISSYWGVTGWPDATAYAASKSGLIALTKTLGRELAPSGIAVNAIAPGVINTPQLQVDAAADGVDLDEIKRRYALDVPLGRIGEPEEIAGAVALLVDPGVEAMVGQVIQVNGGEVRTRA